MGRGRLLGAVFAVAALAAVSAAFSGTGWSLRPLPLAGPAIPATGPLLGLVSEYEGGPTRVVRVDRSTLRRLPGHSVLVGTGGAWSFSPDRGRLVIAARRDKVSDRLRFVDVARMRLLAGRVELNALALGISWLDASHLLVLGQTCCRGRESLLTVDVGSRRVVGRMPLEGRAVAAGRSGGELALLVTPVGAIGTAHLLVADTGGAVRTVTLDRIAAGAVWPQDESAGMIGHVRQPGLAVDPDRRAAYVVDPDRLVARVDLATLAVAYHRLGAPSTALDRIAAWLQPAAQAKGADGPERRALWLGDDLLAVTGTDQSASVDAGQTTHMRVRPAGLEIVDVRSWTAHVLDPDADSALPADGLLLASGATWSADGSTSNRSGTGLAAYGPDGAERFRLMPSRAVWVSQAWGSRAFVGVEDDREWRVVDLVSGRVVSQRTKLPWLLLGDASPVWG